MMTAAAEEILSGLSLVGTWSCGGLIKQLAVTPGTVESDGLSKNTEWR